MQLEYSPESLLDLERLRDFVAEKNPLAAQRMAQELLKGIKNLKHFPLMGVEVKRAPDPAIVRDLVLGPYIVRYLITDKVIYVLRVWHHKENWTVI